MQYEIYFFYKALHTYAKYDSLEDDFDKPIHTSLE